VRPGNIRDLDFEPVITLVVARHAGDWGQRGVCVLSKMLSLSLSLIYTIPVDPLASGLTD
jgi:hypothetical protein